ncbi:MAG: GAF domain-containing protein, partial [Hyphomicrobiales bacterium]
ALAEIAARFTLEEPLETTLGGVAASVRAATSAVASSVMLVEDGRVTAAAGDGLPDHYMEMITSLAPDPSNSILLASASTAATVRVPDVRTHMLREEKWAPMHDLIRDLEWEGVVATPLIYRGRVVGSIGTYYPEGQMPSESELAFLQALCDQAAIGVANGRLFAQSERRVRELDALTRVATQITVDQPLQQTLDELAESVVSASRAVACSVTLVDEHGQFEGAGVANIPRDFPAAIAEAYGRGAPSTAAAAIRSMRPRVLPEARSLLLTDPAFASVRGFVQDAAWEAVVVTPLVLRGEVLGTLDTYYAPDDAPDAQETALLSAIANQASVAVDNARLFTQTEQRVRELEALARVASSLTVAQPMEETLGFLAETVVRSGDAVACSVVLIDPETEELRFAAQRGLPDGYVEAMNTSWRQGVPTETLIAFRTGETQVIRNARETVRTNAAYESIWPYLDQIEWDNVAIVPLSYQGSALGALNCYFPPDKVPGERDINLLRAIADQASAAVQNARLFAETRERARQLDALYRADEELHRSLELDNVLQAIVDVAVEFLGTDGASLVVWDEESDHPHVKLAGQALVAGEEAVLQGLEGHSREEFEEATFRVATDISSEPDLDAQRAATLGVGSFVQVPVVVNGRVFGIFDAAYTEPRPIPADEQRLFLALAQRAAIAIENAQLYAAGAERTRQLDALYRADEALHRSLLLDDVLQALNDVAVELLGADRSMLLSWRADEEYPVIRGASGVDPEMYVALEKSFREHSTRAGFSHREPFVIRDARTDPRAYPERVQIARIKSLIQLPIVVNGEVFGVFFIGWERPQAVTRHDERLFAALAQRAAVAIENAQLYDQAQNLAVVEERNRLARELHDSVSQALYGINLFARTARTLIEREPAKAVEPIDLVLTQAEAGLAEMRALIFALRPESLATEGIVRAIEKHAASARGRYQVQVDLDLCEEPEVPLPMKEALYRIMQEALHNIGKHANASRISIRLDDSPGGVTLDIQDDGAGFNPDEDFPGHLGLTSMKERAARLGGRLTIESAPGEGTHVSAWMPRPAPAEPVRTQG